MNTNEGSPLPSPNATVLPQTREAILAERIELLTQIINFGFRYP